MRKVVPINELSIARIRLQNLRRTYKALQEEAEEAEKEHASKRKKGMYAWIGPKNEKEELRRAEETRRAKEYYSEEIRKIDKELEEIIKKEKESQ